jgi:lipoprotein-releasing system permease protein
VVRIFIYEGNLIALMGACVGLVLGIGLCLLQQRFGIIGLGDGQFVVSAYPVRVQATDVALVLASVLAVSALSVWLPIRMLNRFFYNRQQQ